MKKRFTDLKQKHQQTANQKRTDLKTHVNEYLVITIEHSRMHPEQYSRAYSKLYLLHIQTF